MSDRQRLTIDLEGRVEKMNLSPANGLYALLEAVVNSFHSIEDGGSGGEITIKIHRKERGVGTDKDFAYGDIERFEIIDNGPGFTDENMTSFRTADSRSKAKYGGKGVGRLLWLKVFRNTTISSVFQGGDGNFIRRDFDFTTEGNSRPTDTACDGPLLTTVTLANPFARYETRLRKDPETIAEIIIEHCLAFLIPDSRPKVFVEDQQARFLGELGSIYDKTWKSEMRQTTFEVEGHKFTITHLLVESRRGAAHRVFLCAQRRGVAPESIGGRIAGLSTANLGDQNGKSLAYRGFVSGDYLDSNVNETRTGFDSGQMVLESEEDGSVDSISTKAVINAAVKEAEKFLQPKLGPALKRNAERIASIVNEEFPHYRYLLARRPDQVAAIPTSAAGSELDLELYRIEQSVDDESRRKMRDALGTDSTSAAEVTDRAKRIQDVMAQVNESGMSKLARHVAYRKIVLSVFDEMLKSDKDNEYVMEQALHGIVFPVRKTSADGDVTPDDANLWLIDDRLYYHLFLASDKPLRSLPETVRADSPKRPDIVVFNNRLTFGDSKDYQASVILIEFKRPMRDDYSEFPDADPTAQMRKYVDLIRAGSGRTRDGRPIEVNSETSFFGYLVADLTGSLRKLLVTREFDQTADGRGMWHYYSQQRFHMEVLPYAKVLSDAKKRNRALFDKLNIPFV